MKKKTDENDGFFATHKIAAPPTSAQQQRIIDFVTSGLINSIIVEGYDLSSVELRARLIRDMQKIYNNKSILLKNSGREQPTFGRIVCVVPKKDIEIGTESLCGKLNPEQIFKVVFSPQEPRHRSGILVNFSRINLSKEI